MDNRSGKIRNSIVRRGLAVVLAAMLLVPLFELAASCISYAADERPGYTITVVGEDNSATNLADVADDAVPLSLPPADEGMGILNLVLMIFTCALAIMILLPEIRAGDGRDFASITVSVLTALIAAASVAAFFLTEDFSSKAVMTDRNTALMGEIFLIELMITLYARTVRQD